MKEVVRIFEKRKKDLLHLLEHHRDELSPSKQHQIYGAIKEIDIFIKTLNQKIVEEVEDAKLEAEKIMTTRPDLITKISFLLK